MPLRLWVSLLPDQIVMVQWTCGGRRRMVAGPLPDVLLALYRELRALQQTEISRETGARRGA